MPSALWTPNTNGAALLTSFNTDGFKVGDAQIANFGLDELTAGTSSNDSSNLTFDITATGLSVSSFQSWFGNDQPNTAVYFIADLGVGAACDVPGRAAHWRAVMRPNGYAQRQEQFPSTPIPGAVWLFGTVLAGGAGYGRWRKKRKAQLATAA